METNEAEANRAAMQMNIARYNSNQYKPELAEKRDRHYKAKYIQAEASNKRSKTIAWVLFGLLTLCAYLLGMSLYGGHVLQQRLQDSKTVTILPNGKTLTGK